jgi:hypothetical protein
VGNVGDASVCGGPRVSDASVFGLRHYRENDLLPADSFPWNILGRCCAAGGTTHDLNSECRRSFVEARNVLCSGACYLAPLCQSDTWVLMNLGLTVRSYA